jgi:hypothetical protein
MNARGTRRPHPRRVRSKPVKTSRRSNDSSGGCVLLFVFLLTLPGVLTVLAVVAR